MTLALLFAATPASAASVNTYRGSLRAYAEWIPSSGVMQVVADDSQNTIPSNYCFDSWFDWDTQSGHYDARVARTCRSLNAKYGPRATDTGRTFIGMQRAGLCYGGNNATCANIYTNNASASLSLANVNENLPNWIARGWVLTSAGTNVYYSGGVSSCGDC